MLLELVLLQALVTELIERGVDTKRLDALKVFVQNQAQKGMPK